jgi:hypothetical protein
MLVLMNKADLEHCQQEVVDGLNYLREDWANEKPDSLILRSHLHMGVRGLHVPGQRQDVAGDLMLCTQGWPILMDIFDGNSYSVGDHHQTELFIPPQGFGCTFHEAVVESN